MSIENVTWAYTNEEKTAGRAIFHACKMGDYLTAGRSQKIEIKFEDGKALRDIASTLFHHQTDKFRGIVNLNIGDQTLSLDNTLWVGLSSVLNAFVLAREFDEGLFN